MTPKIIAFGHRRYTGKDTACNFLITEIRATKRNVMVVKTGFATKFKAICHDLYGWAGLQDEKYYDDHPEMKEVVLPKLGKSPRQIWIECGMAFREIFPDTWVLYPLTLKCHFLIIKDLRFPNEADAILDRGGAIYEIENPNIAKYDDPADTALLGYTRWTGKIVNDGDLKTFNHRILAATKEHLK